MKMMDDKFAVRPVPRYQQARYPSSWVPAPPDEPGEERRLNPVQLLVLLVLVMGLASGLIGCLANYSGKTCEPGQVLDSSGNCVGPDPNDCLPGQQYCDEAGNLVVCNDDGESWTPQDCNATCVDQHGSRGYSTGCDAQADDPCQCEYDIIDGDIAECTPGEVQCRGEETVAFCQENGWEWLETECGDYCQEIYGNEAYSLGCNAEAEDPCQCESDIVVGVMPACTPDDFYCQDDDTAMVCEEDGWTFTEVDCAEYCTENFGEDYYSTGCDQEDEENICGCEYGIVDGEPVDP
jgi:hypothetical protein